MARSYFSRIVGVANVAPLAPARPISNLWKSARLEVIPPRPASEQLTDDVPAARISPLNTRPRPTSSAPPQPVAPFEPELPHHQNLPPRSGRQEQPSAPQTSQAAATSPAVPLVPVDKQVNLQPGRVPVHAVIENEIGAVTQVSASRVSDKSNDAPSASRTGRSLETVEIPNPVTPRSAGQMAEAAAQKRPEITPIREPRTKDTNVITLQPALQIGPPAHAKPVAAPQVPASPQNSVHIGRIEVQVVPPPVIRRELPRPRMRLARGYGFWSNRQF